MAAQEFGRVGRATASGQNGKLAASSGNSAGRVRVACPDDIDIASRNDADGICQRDIAHEVIDDAVLFGFRGLAAVRPELPKDFVQAGPAQVAVDEQDTVALLGEGERVVRARETFSL